MSLPQISEPSAGHFTSPKPNMSLEKLTIWVDEHGDFPANCHVDVTSGASTNSQSLAGGDGGENHSGQGFFLGEGGEGIASIGENHKDAFLSMESHEM